MLCICVEPTDDRTVYEAVQRSIEILASASIRLSDAEVLDDDVTALLTLQKEADIKIAIVELQRNGIAAVM